jgi:hypothetical protein
VAGDQAIRTIAIESTDRSAVLRAIEDMGLAGYLNANYAVVCARSSIAGRNATR